MNAAAFKLALLQELRTRYPSWWVAPGLLFGEGAMLMIYWFTSQAFAPRIDGVGDYFTFIVVGELTLALPAFLVVSYPRYLKLLTQENTLEHILTAPFSFSLKLSMHVWAGAAFEMLRIALVASAVAAWLGVFSLNVLTWGLLLFAALPLFCGLGAVGAAVVLTFGRGDRAVAALSTGLTVVAGAYFPVTVLPSFVAQPAALLSPFNVLLEAARETLAHGWWAPKLGFALAQLSITGVIVASLSFYVLELAASRHARRSTPLLFRG